MELCRLPDNWAAAINAMSMPRLLTVFLWLGTALLLTDMPRVASETLQTIPYWTSSSAVGLLYRIVTLGILTASFAVPLLFLWAQFKPSRPQRPLLLVLSLEFLSLAFLLLQPTGYFYRQFLISARECKRCDFEIGGIDLNDTRYDSDLTAMFGEGCDGPSPTELSAGYFYNRGYFFPDRNIFLKFNRTIVYEEMELALTSNPRTECASKFKLTSVATAKGIGIGDSEDRIISTYGLPSEQHESAQGIKYLVYRARQNALSFSLSDGKVKAVAVAKPR